MRNDMYLAADAIRLLAEIRREIYRQGGRDPQDSIRRSCQSGTRFIPVWVKIVRCHRAGSWHDGGLEAHRRHGRRAHRQNAPDLCARRGGRTVAALTIGMAELYGLPVSTTHILSSGVAGTMAANSSGLQWSTIRTIAMAWVLTLPAAMAIAAGLYWVLRQPTEISIRAAGLTERIIFFARGNADRWTSRPILSFPRNREPGRRLTKIFSFLLSRTGVRWTCRARATRRAPHDNCK